MYNTMVGGEAERKKRERERARAHEVSPTNGKANYTIGRRKRKTKAGRKK